MLLWVAAVATAWHCLLMLIGLCATPFLRKRIHAMNRSGRFATAQALVDGILLSFPSTALFCTLGVWGAYGYQSTVAGYVVVPLPTLGVVAGFLAYLCTNHDGTLPPVMPTEFMRATA